MILGGRLEIPHGPHGKLGPVLHLELAEEPVEVLFDGSLGQRFELLVRLGLQVPVII